MKTNKRFITLFLSFIMLSIFALALPDRANAERLSDGNYEYSVANGKAKIEKYYGKEANVVVPTTLGGYEVTEIGIDAFENFELESVTIPEQIERMYHGSFKNCPKLGKVIFNAVKCKGAYDPIFDNCFVREVEIGPKVTIIDSSMFEDLPISSISIPDSVTEIGISAFENTALKSVTIPEQITELGEDAFSNCDSLTTVNYNAIKCSGGVRAIFASCPNLKTVTIGSKVEIIGENLFASLPIENITIPKSVKVIDQNAFAKTLIKNINIPEKIEEINRLAFSGCTNLKDVYYAGSKAAWKKVKVSGENEELLSAKLHYGKVYVAPSKVIDAVKKLKSNKISIELQAVGNSSGYRIQISESRNFKKLLVDKVVTKENVSLNSSKIKNKKTLYVRVQNLMKFGKKTVDSEWSKVFLVRLK